MKEQACLFPGQGTELKDIVNFGRLLLAKEREKVLRPFRWIEDQFGINLLPAFSEENQEQILTDPINIQVVIYTLEVVAWQFYCRLSICPRRFVLMAGHSLGEYAALVAAGVMTFEQGLWLVMVRATEMAKVSDGGMVAAIGLDRSKVEECLAVTNSQSPNVWLANDNAPDQVVISGLKAEFPPVLERLREAGARRLIHLPLVGPFHTPLMEPVVAVLARALNQVDLSQMETPVISNVTAKPYIRSIHAKTLLPLQVCRLVNWRAIMAGLAGQGEIELLVIGPGTALAGLARKNLPAFQVQHITKILEV